MNDATDAIADGTNVPGNLDPKELVVATKCISEQRRGDKTSVLRTVEEANEDGSEVETTPSVGGKLAEPVIFDEKYRLRRKDYNPGVGRIPSGSLRFDHTELGDPLREPLQANAQWAYVRETDGNVS